jgi:hypothetical protein
MLDGNYVGSNKGIKSINELLYNNSILHLLSLNNCGIGDQGLQLITDTLKDIDNKNPLTLSLNQNEITDDGVSYFLKNNKRNCYLRLNGNQITDKSIDLILNEITHENSFLLGLYLNNNKISYEQAMHLLETSISSKQLFKLSLSFESFKNEKQRKDVCNIIIKLITENTTLQTLHIDSKSTFSKRESLCIIEALEENKCLTSATFSLSDSFLNSKVDAITKINTENLEKKQQQISHENEIKMKKELLLEDVVKFELKTKKKVDELIKVNQIDENHAKLLKETIRELHYELINLESEIKFLLYNDKSNDINFSTPLKSVKEIIKTIEEHQTFIELEIKRLEIKKQLLQDIDELEKNSFKKFKLLMVNNKPLDQFITDTIKQSTEIENKEKNLPEKFALNKDDKKIFSASLECVNNKILLFKTYLPLNNNKQTKNKTIQVSNNLTYKQ